MSDVSPILALPLIQPAQAQKHVTHNEALRVLDLLVQPSVLTRGQNVPPAAPAEGERHIVGTAPTGAWAGQANRIALRENGTWAFFAPQAGWVAHVVAEAAEARFIGGVWTGPADRDLQAATLGVNATADTTNRLAVSAAATLLNHAGGGHQLKLNKAAAGDTASLLFQTGFSGRAEMGTAGSDDFAIKVSGDGSSFVEGLRLSAAAGGSLTIGVPVGGTAVTQSPADATAGRLLKVGDFGLGAAAAGSPPVTDCNAALAAGAFLMPASGSTNGPPGTATELCVLEVWLADAPGNLVQRVTRIATGDAWMRVRAAGSFGDWRRIFHAGNVLGAVTQTAGVPTGALIERGASANGEFARFADGTQICTRANLSAANANTADGTLFRSANVTWTFPVAFVAAPVCSGGSVSDADCWVSLQAPSATAVVARVRSTVTKGAALTFAATAIGRWF
jgi:hypothetical protein